MVEKPGKHYLRQVIKVLLISSVIGQVGCMNPRYDVIMRIAPPQCGHGLEEAGEACDIPEEKKDIWGKPVKSK